MVHWIKRLAGEGLSQRAINRATGVSRETIRRILSGAHAENPLRDTLYDIDNPIFTGPVERCPGCGAKVYMPCLACQVRKQKRANPTAR